MYRPSGSGHTGGARAGKCASGIRRTQRHRLAHELQHRVAGNSRETAEKRPWRVAALIRARCCIWAAGDLGGPFYAPYESAQMTTVTVSRRRDKRSNGKMATGEASY